MLQKIFFNVDKQKIVANSTANNIKFVTEAPCNQPAGVIDEIESSINFFQCNMRGAARNSASVLFDFPSDFLNSFSPKVGRSAFGITSRAEYLSPLYTTKPFTETHANWYKDWYKHNISQLQKCILINGFFTRKRNVGGERTFYYTDL